MRNALRELVVGVELERPRRGVAVLTEAVGEVALHGGGRVERCEGHCGRCTLEEAHVGQGRLRWDDDLIGEPDGEEVIGEGIGPRLDQFPRQGGLASVGLGDERNGHVVEGDATGVEGEPIEARSHHRGRLAELPRPHGGSPLEAGEADVVGIAVEPQVDLTGSSERGAGCLV